MEIEGSEKLTAFFRNLIAPTALWPVDGAVHFSDLSTGTEAAFILSEVYRSNTAETFEQNLLKTSNQQKGE